jgi:phage tail sheath protein FI
MATEKKQSRQAYLTQQAKLLPKEQQATALKSIAAAAKDQLFEFNDEITRSNFVNIVEPFLRDIQSKRGIYDYVVVCDETNNTAAVIDNNEFIADIYIKPARSINFIGLTFVATRTGVSFEEIIGNV